MLEQRPVPEPEEQKPVSIYFTDFFKVSPETLEAYGAFDVSLINDLPLFIDPFLLFNSGDPGYQLLHEGIIRYLKFLRRKSEAGRVTVGLLKEWYEFKEVKENWLGFSQEGNRGSGLGRKFALALHENLGTIFRDFGDEKVTRGSHLEKLCLVPTGVGRDNISDFATNLIKDFLLDYTQTFARDHLEPSQRRSFPVARARFSYETETWVVAQYELPDFFGQFVLLTPKDILTRDEIWISKDDFFNNFEQVVQAVPDDQLRARLNNYLLPLLAYDRKMTTEERRAQKRRAVEQTIRAIPEVIEHYIRQREDNGDRAVSESARKVEDTESWFVDQLREFVNTRLVGTEFYDFGIDTYVEARRRVLYLKSVIEDRDGYRIFYRDGESIKREKDLQVLFRLTWFATPSDVNSEVNNGRGPADFAVSRGSRDKSLVEFKLASNSKLKQNLQNQVAIYEKAGDAEKSLKVICYFSANERDRVKTILQELGLEGDESIVLIDARNDNKPSASNA